MATIEERVARLETLLSSLDIAGDVPIPVAERSLEIQTFSNLSQIGLSNSTATEEAIVAAMPDGSELFVDCSISSIPTLSLWSFTGSNRFGALHVLRVNANRVFLTWTVSNLDVFAVVEWKAQYRDVNTPKLSDWYLAYPVNGVNLKSYTDLEQLGLPETATRQEVFDAMPVGSDVSVWGGSAASAGELRPPTGRYGTFSMHKTNANEGYGMLIGVGLGNEPEVFRFMVSGDTVRDWFQTYPEV